MCPTNRDAMTSTYSRSRGLVPSGSSRSTEASIRCGRCGVPSRRVPVDTSGLRSFRAAFVTNARGIAPVGQIDDLSLPVDGTLLVTLTEAYESAGWDPI